MDAYIYQYAVGLVFFLFGLTIAARHGYVGFAGKGARNLFLMCGVLLIFALAQGYLQYAPMTESEAVPYRGGGERQEHLGTALDYGIMVGYFLVILAVGTWYGRRQRTLKDFFFAGQRFSWWMITFSLIATVVGSYSFVKYSQAGYRFGLGSGQTYLNDWLWLPLLIFGWLPILYFSRVTSIPEYFERRFDSRVRGWVTVFILVYLVGLRRGQSVHHGQGPQHPARLADLDLGLPGGDDLGDLRHRRRPDQRHHDRPLPGLDAARHRHAAALRRRWLPGRLRGLLAPPAARLAVGVSKLQSRSVIPLGGHLLAGRHRQHGDVLLPEPGRDHAFPFRALGGRRTQGDVRGGVDPDAAGRHGGRLWRLDRPRPGPRRGVAAGHGV